MNNLTVLSIEKTLGSSREIYAWKYITLLINFQGENTILM